MGNQVHFCANSFEFLLLIANIIVSINYHNCCKVKFLGGLLQSLQYFLELKAFAYKIGCSYILQTKNSIPNVLCAL